MEYKSYEMEMILFEVQDVFANIGEDASDTGEGTYSWKPDRSDS